MKTGSAIFRVVLTAAVAISLCGACRLVHRADRHFGVIEGVVTDSASGAPIFGASVLLKGSRMGSITDAAGHFAVRKVPYGQYTIVVTSIEFQTKEISSVNVFQSTPVILSASLVAKPDTLDIKITVITDDFERWSTGTGQIKGKIVDSLTGEPLIGASVLVKGTERRATTDVEGKFVIWRIPPGHYTLAVTMVGYHGTKLIDSVIVRPNKTTKAKVKLGTTK